jgi:SAM-dependent methyltransferase
LSIKNASINHWLSSHDDPLFRLLCQRYETAKKHVSGRVLDLACGHGRGTHILSQSDKVSFVYGADIDDDALQVARLKLQGRKAMLSKKDLDLFVPPECDWIVTTETLEHLNSPNLFLDKCRKSACQGIVLSVPIQPTVGNNPFHKHNFTALEIDRMMAHWCLESDDRMKEKVRGKSIDMYKLSVYQPMNDVTFIVKTLLRPDSCLRLIRSIREFYPLPAPVIALDDTPDHLWNNGHAVGTKDDFARELESLGVEWTFCNKEIGASAGYNTMLRKTKTPYVCLLDDDFLFFEATVIPRLRSFVHHGICQLAAGSVINSPTDVNANRMSYEGRIEMVNDRHMHVQKIAPSCGPFMADTTLNFFVARTDAIIDAWDNSLPVARHLDFFLTLRNRGARSMFVPEVNVLHAHQTNSEYRKLRYGRRPEFESVFLRNRNLHRVTGLETMSLPE